MTEQIQILQRHQLLFSCFSCYQYVASRFVLRNFNLKSWVKMQLEPLFTIGALKDSEVHAFPVIKLKHFHFYWLIFSMNTNFLPFY